jgi:hypothetical protein
MSWIFGDIAGGVTGEFVGAWISFGGLSSR